MCDPLTIAGTAMAVAGTVVGGVNSANASRYQAQVQDRNAAMDRAAAQDALTRGRIQEERQGVKTGQLIGEQRTAIAANGIEVGYGSAQGVVDDTRSIGFQDAQTIRENAARESKGYEINAWNSAAGASASRANASATLWKTAFDAGGTILSSAKQYQGSNFKFSDTPTKGQFLSGRA